MAWQKYRIKLNTGFEPLPAYVHQNSSRILRRELHRARNIVMLSLTYHGQGLYYSERRFRTSEGGTILVERSRPDILLQKERVYGNLLRKVESDRASLARTPNRFESAPSDFPDDPWTVPGSEVRDSGTMRM